MAAALFIPDDAATVAAIAGGLDRASLGGIQLLGTNLLNNGQNPGGAVDGLGWGALS